MKKPSVVVVGASAGGVEAIQLLLFGLHPNFSCPIVIVQHLPADSQVDPKLVFSSLGRDFILEAVEKQRIEKGHVYFSPPAYHLLLEKDLTLSLSQDDPVNYSRPSIDVLFESAALAAEAAVCGVLLTGASRDGASGLYAIHEIGGYTLVQDPSLAAVPVMPGAAIELFKPDFVGSIPEISSKLNELDSRWANQ